MTKAVYPGTFDPITIGHLDIIKRAAKIFDEVIVAIMVNPNKKCTFTDEERLHFIQKCIKNLPNVKCEIGNGLTVDFAKKHGCKGIIRGIRAVTDYEYELAQATSNMKLDSSIETILMVAKPELSFLSSSIAKEIAMFDGDISDFIPKCISKDIVKRLKINNNKQ